MYDRVAFLCLFIIFSLSCQNEPCFAKIGPSPLTNSLLLLQIYFNVLPYIVYSNEVHLLI